MSEHHNTGHKRNITRTLHHRVVDDLRIAGLCRGQGDRLETNGRSLTAFIDKNDELFEIEWSERAQITVPSGRSLQRLVIEPIVSNLKANS
jgi:hypothetical protein